MRSINPRLVLIPGLLALMLLALGLGGCAAMHGPAASPSAATIQPIEGLAGGDGGESSTDHGFIHTTLMYIPNRILDLFDIARLRLHVGPGIGVGARATEVLDFYLGSYASIYAGLPGPRMRPTPKLPFGVESFSGAEVSIVDATVTGGIGPGYSPSEFGLNLYLLLIGADIGLDPIEALDFITGFFLINLRDDEL